MTTLRRPYPTNPHTTQLLELARRLGDDLQDEPLPPLPPHHAATVADLRRARWAEKNWRPAV